MDVRKLLEKVKTGEMELERAEALLKDLPYEDLGYAKLDHHRALRSGFGETVFCQSKPYLKNSAILRATNYFESLDLQRTMLFSDFHCTYQ